MLCFYPVWQISENFATKSGGGIHASSSSLKVDSLYPGLNYEGGRIHFKANEANKGGALFE